MSKDRISGKEVARYKNPWYKGTDYKGGFVCGPEFYETTAVPQEYRGYLIYERVPGLEWDAVKDGACVSCCAGPNGIRRAVDKKIVELG